MLQFIEIGDLIDLAEQTVNFFLFRDNASSLLLLLMAEGISFIGRSTHPNFEDACVLLNRLFCHLFAPDFFQNDNGANNSNSKFCKNVLGVIIRKEERECDTPFTVQYVGPYCYLVLYWYQYSYQLLPVIIQN